MWLPFLNPIRTSFFTSKQMTLVLLIFILYIKSLIVNIKTKRAENNIPDFHLYFVVMLTKIISMYKVASCTGGIYILSKKAYGICCILLTALAIN
jgi:hypothetical protein